MFQIFVATRDRHGKELPIEDHHAIISDGMFGECFEGDSDGARELASELLAAANEYDALVASGVKPMPKRPSLFDQMVDMFNTDCSRAWEMLPGD